MQCVSKQTLPLNYLQAIVLVDSSDCFELIIHKNKRSCTHWKLIITSYNSRVYKTFAAFIAVKLIQ